MTDVRVSESIAAPAATVWELLGDFGGDPHLRLDEAK